MELKTYRIVVLSILFALSLSIVTSFGARSADVFSDVQEGAVKQPEGQAILADSMDYVLDYNSQAGYGSVYDFVNMQDVDSDYARLVEEDIDSGIGVNYAFEKVFGFDNYAFQYLGCDLEVRGYDYTGIGGYFHESIEVCFGESSNGPWTLLGEITAETPTSYSWSIEPQYSYYYIRIASTGDTLDWGSCNEWRVEYMRTRCTDRISYNVGVTIDTAHDSDNLYPYKGAGTNSFYTFTCTARNEEGGYVIRDVRLSGQEEVGIVKWTVRWDPFHTPVFWVSYGVSVALVESECSSSSSGEYRTVNFAIQIKYIHDEVENMDFRLYHSTATSSDEDTYDTISGLDLDVKPDLAFSTAPTMTGRCDTESYPDIHGTVEFADSPTNLKPNPDYAYVYASQTQPSTWTGGQYLDSSGDFNLGVLASGSAGTVNSYDLAIYASSTLNDISNLAGSASTKTDEVVVYDYGVSDSWLNTGAPSTLYSRLKYASDDTEISTGSFTWNGVEMGFNGSFWTNKYTLSYSDPTTIVYDSIAVVTSEGVSSIQSNPSCTITWDRIYVSDYRAFRVSDLVEDYCVDVETQVFVEVRLQYEEEGSWLTDGLVEINGYSASYQSDGWWRISSPISRLSAGIMTFDSVECSGNTPRIDVVNQNLQSTTVRWDAFAVDLSVDDAHVNIGDTVTVWVRVTRAYDGSIFTDSMGTVNLKHPTTLDIPMLYSPVDQMWYAEVIQTSVNQWSYYVSSITDTIEGITAVGRIHFDGIDDYVSCGSDSSLDLTNALTLSTWFYGDGSSWGSGMYLVSKKEAGSLIAPHTTRKY